MPVDLYELLELGHDELYDLVMHVELYDLSYPRIFDAYAQFVLGALDFFRQLH